jgi:hypothetical protein
LLGAIIPACAAKSIKKSLYFYDRNAVGKQTEISGGFKGTRGLEMGGKRIGPKCSKTKTTPLHGKK